MSSVGRWVLTHTELEPAVHAFLSQFQLERLSFRGWFRSFCLLAREPGPELFILVADKFQGFGHDSEMPARQLTLCRIQVKQCPVACYDPASMQLRLAGEQSPLVLATAQFCKAGGFLA